MNVEDTIVAVSSPPGSAVRGILRLSGPQAISLVDRLFRTETPTPLVERTGPCYVEGHLRVEPTELPAGLYLYHAPKSYTRQDIVEIHLLGAPAVLGLVMEDLLAAGARRAEPGEFTARAYLAGAFDLAQVHGIAGMTAARSDLELRAAERLLHGALSQTANRAREELADLLSLVEGTLDFADEPVDFITAPQLQERLTHLRATLETTTEAGLRAERWGQLPQVLLAGPTNAGKSSLMNRLTGMDRAICASVAGTTRDVLSALLCLGEMDVLLLDVAGIDDVSGSVEARAQAAAHRAMGDADLLLWVIDASCPTAESILALETPGDVPVILVANKCDLISEDEQAILRERLSSQKDFAVCPTSAVSGAGCGRLKEMIASHLTEQPLHAGDASIALMAEHRQYLRETLAALDRAIGLAGRCGENLENGDLIAIELHIAASALAMLVGQDQTEELLGRIFSRFCIGK